MSWFKNVFSSQQETKVVYEKSKSESENKEDKKEGEEETVTVSELRIDEGQESSGSCSQNSWWSSWSGLSTPFKRELSDDKEDEKWWSSFCSQETKNELLFSSQADKEDSSQSVTASPENIPTQTCIDKDDNVKEGDSDEGKVKFFIRVGKHKKFKYF